MHKIEADIPTAEASRFLQQLCKHWRHKFEVTFTPLEGRVPFSAGNVCFLSASPQALQVRIEAGDAAEAERLGGVVFKHLERFSFRDPLPAPAWRAV